MSADNFHAVIHARGRFYVVTNLSASVDDYDYGRLITQARSSHVTRSAALVAAHDLERDQRTEYGVIEVEA